MSRSNGANLMQEAPDSSTAALKLGDARPRRDHSGHRRGHGDALAMLSHWITAPVPSTRPWGSSAQPRG